MTALSSVGSLAFLVLRIIGCWKIFEKAGRPGWAAIVPFYNHYVLFDIVWGNGWLFLLLFLPLGGTIALLISYYQLAMRFGKSTGFGVGMIFLSSIFLFILGIEDPEYVQGTFQDPYGNYYTQQYIANGYQGPRKNGRTAAIISSVVGGIVGFLLMILMVFGIFLAVESLESGDWDVDTFVEEILEEVE